MNKWNFENSCVLLTLEENWKNKKYLRNLFRCKEWTKVWEINLDDCEITEKEYNKRRKNTSSDFLIKWEDWRFFDWYDSYEYLEWTKKKQRNFMLFCVHSCEPNCRMYYNKYFNCLEFISTRELKEFEVITVDFWKDWTAYWNDDVEFPFFEDWKQNRWVYNYYWDEDVHFLLKLEDWYLKNISTNFIPTWTILWQIAWRTMKNKKEIGEFIRKRKYIGWWNVRFIEYSRTKEVIYIDYLNNKFNFIEEVESSRDTNITIKRNKETWKFDIIAKRDILSWEHLKANFVFRQ